MIAYTLRRLMLIPLTLFGIMLVNFAVVQFAPGGPVELMLAKVEGTHVEATARVSGAAGGESAAPRAVKVQSGQSGQGAYRGAQGLDPAFVKEIERQFGFDKPAHERFVQMLGQYARFDFGKSFYRDVSVVGLVIEKMPVSVSLGLWSTLIIYLVSIPLGIYKARHDGSRLDIASSWAVIVGYAVPGFLFAILLIVVFAGGKYFAWFPLRGLTTPGLDGASFLTRAADYLWHLALPVTALVVGGFASLTMLTKNSFLEEINKQYVITARAKGLAENRVLYGHVFRNAMLLIVAGFPRALVGILFTGSVLVEIIFSLDGIGLLGFEAVSNRDYPVMFGTLYAFSLLGLVLNLVSDLTYHWVDPRIDFSGRGG
ncbi:microcin C ABC transporter permease YejB [Magnetospirillum sp. SS-4]|uniref:microcin C ABC transporter permease YejB n=1 Tax=Magnetospirillum sp. SS-4 TaxID=2681465 RepID=UPI00137FB593|nr:microcin C ABC transporter permease YejB [Magnetospirillum sp. SS-4]CAA7623209.1 putative oligopeptide transporter subunit; permease component of ABC superfamily [Magnetospirillum sp. SS-4]